MATPEQLLLVEVYGQAVARLQNAHHHESPGHIGLAKDDLKKVRAALLAAMGGDDDEHAADFETARDIGADFVLKRLSSLLGDPEWFQCDGTETWEGDVAGTIWNILVAAKVIDKNGKPAVMGGDAVPTVRITSEQSAAGHWQRTVTEHQMPVHSVWSSPIVDRPSLPEGETHIVDFPPDAKEGNEIEIIHSRDKPPYARVVPPEEVAARAAAEQEDAESDAVPVAWYVSNDAGDVVALTADPQRAEAWRGGGCVEGWMVRPLYDRPLTLFAIANVYEKPDGSKVHWPGPPTPSALAEGMPRRTATVEELEALLNSEDDTPIEILSDGSIRALPPTPTELK